MRVRAVNYSETFFFCLFFLCRMPDASGRPAVLGCRRERLMRKYPPIPAKIIAQWMAKLVNECLVHVELVEWEVSVFKLNQLGSQQTFSLVSTTGNYYGYAMMD